MPEESFAHALRRLRGTLSVRDVARLASVGKSTVGDLETGRRQPTSAVAAALDAALHAGGQLVRLAEAPPGTPVREQAAALQRGLVDALAAGPMSAASLEEWEYTIVRHGRATRWRPEADLLPELVSDFGDLQRLLAHRHPVQVRRRLVLAAAQMSGLMALTLLKLGDPASRDWWRTGRAAAAAAEDRAALSWMYAQESYQLYYGSDLEGAVELAARAQHLAGGLPCVGVALAAPLEARALALLGRREQAADALQRAAAALQRLPAEQHVASAFGYSESQLAFHSGNAWTHLGETERAWEHQRRALEIYPESDRMDRALIQLDRAVCLAQDGDPAQAAAHAVATLDALPEEHRSALIIYRAQELAARVPEARSVLEVRVLREVLELPAGS
ncbi:helix-turn-helix domain-containing protein [Peterkaempfera griseoplana]|uniref:helix-turn-helix domain-containing protein n=1 Tax=Peterkaempfera griseoplana TaxID=66896 RepID=UPI0006E3B383|nr:helix-turn-helix transcriptional regulator [Peterkaempfera griseoplana]